MEPPEKRNANSKDAPTWCQAGFLIYFRGAMPGSGSGPLLGAVDAAGGLRYHPQPGLADLLAAAGAEAVGAVIDPVGGGDAVDPGLHGVAFALDREAVPVVGLEGVAGLFVGMVMALQAYYALVDFGAEDSVSVMLVLSL